MKDILLIPNIKIQNANALSSPYSVGFPAMTAWLGFMHALERKLWNTQFSDIKFTGIIVSCLDINLKRYRGRGDYIYSLMGTRNPLTKDGEGSSFVEEAKCNLEVTLAIEVEMGFIDHTTFTEAVDHVLHTMKVAGGDIVTFKSSQYFQVDDQSLRKLTRYLMPGFCPVSRQDLMQKSMSEGEDAIDAMLGYLVTTTEVEIDEKGREHRTIIKKENGWLVPISIGYQGISDLGKLKNTRDNETEHRFAESVVTLGEFKQPYHFDSLEEMIWRYQPYQNDDLYICQNNYPIHLNKNHGSKL